MDQIATKREVHDCNLYREGVCSKVPKHGLVHRVIVAVLGTSPGILLLLFSSGMGAVISQVSRYIPEIFWPVLAIVILVYIFVIWKAAYKNDRTSIEDYATTSAALFSTIVATLQFLKLS